MNKEKLFVARWILLFLMMVPMTVTAKVRLPHIISDGMVLQQQTEVRLWGWNDPGKKIKVSVSWSQNPYIVQTGTDGKWMVRVKTPKGGDIPYRITFDDGEKTVVNQVLIGEVYVCGGQSNMEMTLKGYGDCPIEGYNEAVLASIHQQNIHYVKMPHRMSMHPLEDTPCEWKSISPETVTDCSAIGYFFASLLQRTLNVPVGLVEAYRGGSRVEGWLDRENLSKYTKEPLDSAKIVAAEFDPARRCMVWHNGVFAPILNYTVNGILFYQGCSNVGDPGNQYSERLELLVKQWRKQFGLGDIPFYNVQLAPYWCGNDMGTNFMHLREQQYIASKKIPNSVLICLDDLVYPYERRQLHPCQKRQIGERIAYHALNKQYGMKNILCESPTFKEMRISNDTCYLRLDNTYGAMNLMEDVCGFELAGEDKVFHPAKAEKIEWKDLGFVITCPEVKKPVALRYAFRNFYPGNLKNAAGLPLYPFRTDDWELK